MIWSAIVLYFSANSKSELGTGFSLYSWLMITRFFGLIGSGLFFVLRVARLIRKQTNFFYCFFAVVNCSIGIVALLFYFIAILNRDTLYLFLLNLLVGVILLADIFFFRTIFNRS